MQTWQSGLLHYSTKQSFAPTYLVVDKKIKGKKLESNNLLYLYNLGIKIPNCIK